MFAIQNSKRKDLNSRKKILNDYNQGDAETLKFNIVQKSTYYGMTPIRARP